jgi:hypothetical protein
MIDNVIIEWLPDSDISIQYQVYRDLLKIDKPEFKARIAKEDWCAQYLKGPIIAHFIQRLL